MASYKVKGAFVDVAVVENLDTVDETETLLERTKGDVEIEIDETTVEADDEHSNDLVHTDLTRANVSINLGSYVDPDVSFLQTLGVLDANGDLTMSGRELEAVRVRAFPDRSDTATADTVIEAVEVVPEVDDGLTFGANEFAETSVTLHVNGNLNVVAGA